MSKIDRKFRKGYDLDTVICQCRLDKYPGIIRTFTEFLLDNDNYIVPRDIESEGLVNNLSFFNPNVPVLILVVPRKFIKKP